MASSVHTHYVFPVSTDFYGIKEQIGEYVAGKDCDLTVTIPVRDATFNFSCSADPAINAEKRNNLYHFLHLSLLSGDNLHKNIYLSFPEELTKPLKVVKITHTQKFGGGPFTSKKTVNISVDHPR